jgi:hypothetical protein
MKNAACYTLLMLKLYIVLILPPAHWIVTQFKHCREDGRYGEMVRKEEDSLKFQISLKET